MTSLPAGGRVGFFSSIIRTHLLIREAVKEKRAKIHATFAQLRLEPVLRFLADFSNCLAHLYFVLVFLFNCSPLGSVNMLHMSMLCSTELEIYW
jgi:hypothetical protein